MFVYKKRHLNIGIKVPHFDDPVYATRVLNSSCKAFFNSVEWVLDFIQWIHASTRIDTMYVSQLVYHILTH